MAFGNQLVRAHIALRERLEALRDGLVDGVFPVPVREDPELRPVLDKLGRDHRIVSEALTALDGALDVDPAVLRREVDSVGALVGTHFTYEERKIADLLSAMTGRLGAVDAELITRATTATDDPMPPRLRS